ncbi:MAG: MBL fold metallo-hydrolase [Oscillospiraceae bacterium]
MAKLCTLASSSSGNSTYLESRSTSILIDAGISCRRLCSCLTELNCEESALKGVLITHEHSDHISGLCNFLKKFNIPVYSTSLVLDELLKKDCVNEDMIREISYDKPFSIDDMEIEAFKTPHDSVDSVGFRINTPDEHSFGVATDMGKICENVLTALKGCETVILEANYDPDLLRMGNYPYFLKQRIISANGHLPNEESGKMALNLFDNGTMHFILAHLSKHNNTPSLAYQTVEDCFTNHGAYIHTDYELTVAPYDTMSPIMRR